ncbi:MAG: hypothetical protein R3F28_03990 [Candidatus Kapaibacterium sp.]
MHYHLFSTKRLRRISVTFGLSLIFASASLLSQNRDFSAERLIIDDNAGDGVRNTMTLRVPPTGLTANRTVTFPDADGTVLTVTAPLNPNEILFGSPTGQAAQNANLLWDNGAGIFNIGAGNFTVAAATGDVQTTGNIQADGTIQSGSSIIIDGTTPGSHNIAATGGENLTITPTGGTLFIAAPVLNHGSGLFTVDPGTLQYGSGLFTVDPGTLQYGSGLFTVDPGTLQYGSGLFTVDPGTLQYGSGLFTVDPGTLTYNGSVLNMPGIFTVNPTPALNLGGGFFTVDPGSISYNAGLFTVNPGTLTYNGAVVNVPGTLVVDPGTFSFSGGVLTGDPGTLNYNSGLFTVDPGPSLNLAAGFFTVNPGGISYNSGVFTVSPTGTVTATGTGSTFGDGTDAEQLQVDGVDGGAVEVDINGDADISGNLSVGTLILNGDLDMNDNDIFNVDELRGNSATGDLNVNTTNTGDVNIGNGSGDVNVDANVIPTIDNTYSLGTDALRWSGVFVNGGSVHIGDAGGVGTDEVVIGYNGTTTGTIGVNGTTAINVTAAGVNVTGSLDVDTDLNVDGNTTHAGTTDLQGFVGNTVGDLNLFDNVNVTGDFNIGAGNFTVASATGNTDIGGTLNADGATILNGAVTLGDAAADAITFTGQVASDIVPNADATYDLGSNTNRFDELFVSGPTIHIGSSADEAQISFNGGTGLELDGNDDGSSDLTIDGATGDVSIAGALSVMGPVSFPASPLTLGDDVTPTPGQLILEDNTAANGFQGTVETAPALTADRTYTLPDASGVISLVGDIITDATLIGDGSGGNPLGINLTNNNSWTGAQTFTTVDVNGGTIDATTIGGVTPATGTFTTISDGAGSTIAGGTVTAVALTDGIASMSGGTISDGFGASMFGGTVTGFTVTDGIASMSGGTISDGFGASMFGGTVTGFTVTDGIASMSGGTISDGAGSTISGGSGTFGTITGTALPSGSTSTDLVTSNGGALETRTIASLGGSIAVSTDATLTGDGTTGNPLGIDLTNANNWTGGQTFSSVDINGGTVDGSAIGSSSPSTGAFTTITGRSTVTLGDDLFPTRGRVILHDNLDLNGFLGTLQTASVLTGNRTYTLPDATGTLGVIGNIPVSTDASLTGDGTSGNPLGIDLTNANNWTGAQTFSSVDINGGTVDGSAIGSSSPSTGAFTTITGGSTVTLGDDLFPTRGRVILHDNLDLNGFLGTIQTASVLTGNRTYTFQDGSGTVAFLSDIAVTTNSTLLGDGTGGDPLRINLSNTNTWTGTQTFGPVAVLSIATFDADVTLGDSPTDAITMNGTLAGATPLSFEGSTSDVNETTFAITDPTADRIITFQDGSGTVAFLSDVAVTTNSTLLGDGTGGDPLRINLSNTNTWTGTQTFGPVNVLSIATFDADMTLGDSPTDAITVNGTLTGATPLSFEGSTSDVNETTFAITDPTADRTITFQDGSGTVAFLSDVAVTTNSTLLGDGSGGDPLRINLSNANTWTGTQTLPVTAAQGDALIASTNVGTATINAARIGAGLTDAQVNDNLTIDGGTVNATPIGGTTPSTGVFTQATINSAGGTDLVITETGVDRSSGSAETFAIDNSGAGAASLVVNATTGVTNSRIVINEGHWTSQGTAPTAAGDGTNLAAAITVSTTSTDVAGFVTSTDGGAVGIGVITVTFNAAYTTDPIVVVTPGDAATAGAGFFVSNIGTTSFDINLASTLGDGTTTYSFYYQVIEND